MRRFAFIAVLALGCGKSFTPDSLVNGFRALAVQAEPPEIHPSQTTTFSALVVDPSRPGQNNTLLWLGCDPDPFDLGRSACNELGNLNSASALLSAVDGGQLLLPTGINFLNWNDETTGFGAAYTAPDDAQVFDPATIPAGDPRRLIGTIADTLVVAAAGDLPLLASADQKNAFFTQIEDALIPATLVIERVVVSENPNPNHNPVFGDLLFDGTAIPDGGTFRIAPGADAGIELTAPDSSFETFTEIEPDGTTLTKQEGLIAAYYSTTGSFSQDRIALRSGFPETFAAPAGTDADPIPDKRLGTMWIVLRDTRGGLSWNTWPMFICDPTLPAPSFTALDPPTGRADGTTTMGVQGQNISSVLDLLVGGIALRQAAFSPVVQEFSGLVPPLPSGSYPVTVRGKDCQDYNTGLTYVVP
jgi:hypothetical protein